MIAMMRKAMLWPLSLVVLSTFACVALQRGPVGAPPGIEQIAANEQAKPLGIADLDPHMIVEISSPLGSGTGFPIAKLGEGQGAVYMTAAHVVRTPSRKPYAAGVLQVKVGIQISSVYHVEYHPSLDVALLWAVNDYVSGAFNLRSAPPVFGEPIRAAGWFLGSRLIVSSGNVGLNTMSAPLFFGMSGGPILDANNKIIGVMNAVYFTRDPQGIDHPIMIANQYSAIAEMLDWLHENGMID